MPQVLTLVVPQGASLEPDVLARKLAPLGLPTEAWGWIEPGRAGEWRLNGFAEADNVTMAQRIGAALEDAAIDFALQPDVLRRKKLLLSDMDSTLIGQECIDELANIAGIGAQVAAITERAMRGELEFEGALRERVALLKGLPASVLARVWEEKITLNEGGAELMATMRRLHALTVLVSGGFEFFTGHVCEALGMDAHFANRLPLENDQLLGTVLDPILGSAMKRQVLEREAQILGIGMAETLAVGDGANDLPMLQAAGLGVAYRAKPIAEQGTSARIRHTDLSTVLYFQGIPHSEWAKDI